MINFTPRTRYFISSKPTDMRNGREGLAGIVREVMGHNPKCYDEAFIFYSKDYRKVKILHYDLNGYVMYHMSGSKLQRIFEIRKKKKDLILQKNQPKDFLY